MDANILFPLVALLLTVLVFAFHHRARGPL